MTNHRTRAEIQRDHAIARAGCWKALAKRAREERRAAYQTCGAALADAHAALDEAGMERAVATETAGIPLSLRSRILNLAFDRDEAADELKAAREAIRWLMPELKVSRGMPKSVYLALVNAHLCSDDQPGGES